MLDEPSIKRELLYQNLKELEIINTYLGGHAISLKGLKQVWHGKHELIADIGCGGGDSVKVIAKNFGNKVQVVGLDIKQDCIDYSRKNCETLPNAHFYLDDFMHVFSGKDKPSIVHASLFFHHFTEDQISDFLSLCQKNNAIAIINDLERNPIAYHSIKMITKAFSKSPLVKNDAPLSVLRGFKKSEWKSILKKAGVKKYSVTNQWAFRHLVIAYPNGQ